MRANGLYRHGYLISPKLSEILLNKLEGFFSDLGWSLDLNPHINGQGIEELKKAGIEVNTGILYKESFNFKTSILNLSHFIRN